MKEKNKMTKDNRFISFPPFKLDLKEGALIKGKKVSSLTGTQFKVLKHFLENKSELLLRSDLIDQFWRNSNSGDWLLTKTVSGLRKELGENVKSPEIIKTEPGKGYRFIGNIKDGIMDNNLQNQGVTPGFVSSRRDMGKYLNKYEAVHSVKEIDLLGWTFNREFFEDPAFYEPLYDRLKKKQVKLRVILPAKSSKYFATLKEDRLNVSNLGKKEAGKFEAQYMDTIERIQEVSPKVIRFLNKAMVHYGTIRFDDQMVLTLFDSFHIGSMCPAIVVDQKSHDEEIRECFKTWKTNFEKYWKISLKTNK